MRDLYRLWGVGNQSEHAQRRPAALEACHFLQALQMQDQESLLTNEGALEQGRLQSKTVFQSFLVSCKVRPRAKAIHTFLYSFEDTICFLYLIWI